MNYDLNHNSTIQYYDKNADTFVESTLQADMRDIYQRFEELISDRGRILDLGCGSGRDSRYFSQKGYKVLSMDASIEMCNRTRKIAKTPIVHGYAEEMDFDEEFDAIWACASLLHIESSKMQCVMSKIERALKPGGVLYASWKYGDGAKYVDERFYQYETLDSVEKYIANASRMKVYNIWMTEDVRKSSNQKWINLLAKKYK